MSNCRIDYRICVLVRFPTASATECRIHVLSSSLNCKFNLGIDEDHVLHLCLNATVSVQYRNEVVQTIEALSCTKIDEIKSVAAPKVQTMIPEFSSISTAKIQDHMMLFNVDGVQAFDDIREESEVS